MQSRLPWAALAPLVLTFTTLGGPQAFAHDAPGSTQAVVPVADYVFHGEVNASFFISGPPAGEEILHATLDLTYDAPQGGMWASDVVIEIGFPLTSGTATWVIHGHELGWPDDYGIFSATLDSDAFNGVLDGPAGATTVFHETIGSESGNTWGHFVASTLTLELAGDVCQPSLGFAGPGNASITLCGEPLATGNQATFSLRGAPANTLVYLVVGVENNPTPFNGGTLVPIPFLDLVPIVSDGSGKAALPVAGGTGLVDPVTVYLQGVTLDGSQAFGYGLTNALAVELLP